MLISGGLIFNLAKPMVSVLHYKELEYKVEKLRHKKLEVMQPRMKKKSVNFHLVNKPSTQSFGRD